MALTTPLERDRANAPERALARVAIAGATGYARQELVRILARHPRVTLTAAMSSGATSAPRPLPALARIWDGTVQPLDVDRLLSEADVVFLALPEAASAELAPKLLERGVRVIDLFTPLCAGQRIGIFAGSGIGKSTLLGMLARSRGFDIAIIALVGERGREVREFLEDALATDRIIQ